MVTLASTVAPPESANACHVHQHDDSSRITLISQYLRNPTPDREAESYILPPIVTQGAPLQGIYSDIPFQVNQASIILLHITLSASPGRRPNPC